MASTVTRSLGAATSLAFRHSTANDRFGALPDSCVRTLAEPSMFRSSQNGATTAAPNAVAGIAALAQVFTPALVPKLSRPLVSTHALVYARPWKVNENGSVTWVAASSPESDST